MRSNARCSSPVSHSSMRLRSDALGNKAAAAPGSGFWFNAASGGRLSVADGQFERLVEIGEDVVDVLDSHTQANAARCHPRGQLLLRRHLPMRRRCRMAGERFSIAQIHQALEKLERVVEAHAGFEPAADLEGNERTSPAAQVF